MKTRASQLLEITILALVYVVTAMLGLLLDPVSGFATLVWAPTGIALAALLVYGYRLWPGVALGAFVVNAWAGAPLAVAGGIAIGNTLEALASTYCLRRFGFHNSMDRLRDVLALAVFAGGASPMISATFGVTSLWLGGIVAGEQLEVTWLAWWWGNLAGALLVAPLLLTWRGDRVERVLGRPRRGEAIALAGSLVLVGAMVFFGLGPSWLDTFRGTYSLVPIAIWAGVRFGPRGAASTSFLYGSIAGLATTLGLGPFALPLLYESLLASQSFMAVSSLSTLSLGAIAVERARLTAKARTSELQKTAMLHEVQRARDGLERKVEKRVADLVQVNLDLARREEQLREAQALAQLGSFDWDLEHQRLRWSDELYRIYGLEPGAPITIEDALERVHPDGRDRVRTTIEHALADHQPFQLEERILRPDGSVRILLSQGKVEVSPAGRPVRLLGTCQDITEHRLSEQARSRLAAIVESSEDAIIGWTLDRTIESWNRGAEKMYGYSAAEAIGRPITLVVPEERHDDLTRVIDLIRSGERVVGFESVRRRKDGSLFEASITMSPILDRDGRIIGTASIARDVTELKESVKQKEVLVREIHHRVKNNLQVIASLLHLQASRVAGDEARRGFEESQSRIQSIALVHRLLYQSKDLASIEFEEYLRDLVAWIARSYGIAAGTIEFAVAAPRIRLDIDTSVPCGLIVNELVSNSLKHAFPDGRHGLVAVSLHREGDGSFVLVVADDGIGIAEHVQLETVRTLGLQIVRTLTSQLHGTVEVFRNHGTTFRIRFPDPGTAHA